MTETTPPPYAEIEAALEKANRELDEAMLRLGSLGLNPVMPSDLAELCARLGAMGTHGLKSYPTHDINPDGRDAAAAIEHLNTRVQELETAARNWQRVVEGGEEVVEVIALAMDDAEDNFATDALDADNFWRFAARAVLAALREGEG